MELGADFAYVRYDNYTHILIYHDDVKEFLWCYTGRRWVTIHVDNNDPILSMLFLKFRSRPK